MKKLEQHFKKQRNDTDTQVKKYKKDLDVIGIRYDHKSAHVEVPNHATGGFEYFKWDWMTSTTSSHSEIVQIFKKIVRTLKEAKNNPVQYENLVSKLDASTKNALDVNIKKHNITVPTQQISQEELVEKALAEAERGTKENNVTAEFKDHFSKLDPDGVVEFMHRTKGTTINVDGCVGTALRDVVDIKYPATWKGVSTQKFFIENGITNPYASFDSKIEPSMQSEVQEEAYNSATASTTDQGASFEEEDSDDDIEVISQLLESKVTLNNGTTIEVKAILKDLSDKEFVNMVLKRVTPDIAELVEKEIVLKLVYDVQKGLITKRDAGKIIYSFNDDFDLSDGWLANNNLSIDEIKAKEVEITGGASYLE